ncbi:MAG: mannitol dehydrogenase family protein, partial [Bradyrhizobium sp.]
RYVSGTDEQGQPIALRDPLAVKLRALADDAGPVANRLAPALLSVTPVCGHELPNDPRFARTVEAALDRLFLNGTRATVEQILQNAG